jgi:hypothetical protein
MTFSASLLPSDRLPWPGLIGRCARPGPFLLKQETYPMFTTMIVTASAGFGALLAAGLVADGMAAPWTAYWAGLALLVASLVALLAIVCRQVASLREFIHQ